MNSCLVDVNVLLAMFAVRHKHHSVATRWSEGIGDGELGICRSVQLSVIRLLATRRVMGEDTIGAGDGWRMLQRAMGDARVAWVEEGPEIGVILPAMWRYAQPTPQLVNDGYLAALALSTGRRLVTFDQGFREFPGLRVRVLGEADEA